MKIIFGLGNPGEKYLKTRHNLGFMFLDLIAEKFSANFEKDQKSKAEIAKIDSGGEKILLVKPQDFMNNSGNAVQSLSHYYKIDSQNIVIIHDDIDLPFGKIKISQNSGPAGHKGVASIINLLGTQDFKRIRFGIKNENNQLPTEIFVLKNFSKEELESIHNLDIEAILEGII